MDLDLRTGVGDLSVVGVTEVDEVTKFKVVEVEDFVIEETGDEVACVDVELDGFSMTTAGINGCNEVVDTEMDVALVEESRVEDVVFGGATLDDCSRVVNVGTVDCTRSKDIEIEDAVIEKIRLEKELLREAELDDALLCDAMLSDVLLVDALLGEVVLEDTLLCDAVLESLLEDARTTDAGMDDCIEVARTEVDGNNVDGAGIAELVEEAGFVDIVLDATAIVETVVDSTGLVDTVLEAGKLDATAANGAAFVEIEVGATVDTTERSRS